MPLYLVRHAHAVSLQEDPQRPLSERGRAQVRSLATFFFRNGLFTPAYVWHSPLARARETAELFLIGLSNEAALVVTPGLLPEDNPIEIANRLNGITSAVNVALVGHEPHLGALASLLIRGKSEPELFDLKKGSILALERTDDIHKKTSQSRWRASWHITPDLLTVRPTAPEVNL